MKFIAIIEQDPELVVHKCNEYTQVWYKIGVQTPFPSFPSKPDITCYFKVFEVSLQSSSKPAQSLVVDFRPDYALFSLVLRSDLMYLT